MSDREIMNAKYGGLGTTKKASEILKEEYPTIYTGYMDIMEEQLELFSKTEDERSFALTGLWYRISDKVNRWKNMIITKRDPQNESLLDSFQDLTNYGIIAQLVATDRWKK